MTVQYQGVWSLQNAAQLQSTQRWVTDPLFENTTLLLQADDAANGAQNNTFLDSSSNSFAITRNGNTTQGTFTPFSSQPGAWGNFFNGSSDFLNIGSGYPASLDLGSGNFTIEGWVYLQATTKQLLLGNLNDSNGTCTFFVILNNTSASARYEIKFGSSAFNLGAGTLPTNQWVHVCVMRSGTSIFLFENGAQVGATQTYSGSIPVVANQMRVGGAIAGQYPLSGYASNLRMVIGSTVYSTSGFTVPTTPLTAITNTALLTCRSNSFFDSSANAISITTSGAPSVQAFSPFAPQFQWTPSVIGGSGYFDGTGDWLTVPSNTALTLSTGAFTLEFWAYCTNFSSATRSWLSNRNGTETNRWGIDSSTSGTFYLYGNGGFVVTSAAVAPNQWVHVCVTRANTSTNGVRIFINGRLDAVGTSATDFAADIVSIGASPSGSQPSIGYIANARIIKGSIPTDYQTSSTTTGTQIFTPPSAPSTTTSQGATSSNVSLLTNFTNAGIVDGTMKNNLETVGNAQISTAVVKYGSGSMAFDGSGDYLFLPQSGNPQNLNWELVRGDFTIEFWFYANTVASTFQGLIVKFNGNATARTDIQYFIRLSTSSLICTAYQGATNFDITFTGIATGQWYHVAMVRQANVVSAYLNGVRNNTTQTITGDLNSGVNWPLQIGRYTEGSVNYDFNGYMDDLRITKGIARYTANFIPPSVALPRQ